MAIRIFCTTFCTALAIGATAGAAAPALAFDLAAASSPAQADAAQRQPAEIISVEPSAFGKPAAPAGPMAADGSLAQLIHGGATELPAQLYSEAPQAPEQNSLPLLGAAAIALLVAQLRRSRRPMP
jgi:hypothetical protein